MRRAAEVFAGAVMVAAFLWWTVGLAVGGETPAGCPAGTSLDADPVSDGRPPAGHCVCPGADAEVVGYISASGVYVPDAAYDGDCSTSIDPPPYPPAEIGTAVTEHIDAAGCLVTTTDGVVSGRSCPTISYPIDSPQDGPVSARPGLTG